MDSKQRRRLLQRSRAAQAQRAAGRWQEQLAQAPVREVAMTDLTRSPSRTIAAVREGEVVVLSKHRRAVAMIVPLFDEQELAPLDVRAVEGLAELAKEFRRREAARKWSAFMHGRLHRRG